MNSTTENQSTEIPNQTTEMHNLTIGEFGEEIGQDYMTASAVIKFLESAGIAKANGTRAKAPGTRGKAATTYDIPSHFELVLFQPQPEQPVAPVAPEVVPTVIPPVEVVSPVQPVVQPVVEQNNP